MCAVEAVTEVRVGAPQAVHCWGAESHEQWLTGCSGRGACIGLREELEASSDQYRGTAAMLQLKGLGGFHATYKAPL